MKKILISAPRDPKRIISSIPFLHGLFREFPGCELNIVLDRGLEKFYSFLPFQVKLYPIKSQHWTLPEIHKFAKTLVSIHYIDLYFDLENSFKSAYLGLAFGCTERVGMEKGIKRFLYNKKITWKEEHENESFYLRYLEEYIGRVFKDLEVSGKVETKDGPNPLVANGLFGDDVNPTYIIVLIEDLGERGSQMFRVNRDGTEEGAVPTQKEIMWQDFFNFFQGQRFIFWSNSLDEELNDYIKTLSGANEYFHQRGNNYSNLIPIIRHSKAVITDSKEDSYLSAYGEIPTFLLVDESEELFSFEYFKKVPCVISLKNCVPAQIDLSYSKKDIKSMNQVVDFVHEILHL